MDINFLNHVITKNKFNEIINKFKILKRDDNKFKRIDVLKSIGIDYKNINGNILFYNKKYPLMFYGISVLSKSKNVKYGYTGYLLCDYRSIDESFEFTFSDSVLVLNEKYKKTANEMNVLMEKIGAKLKIKPMRDTLLNSYWKLQYTKKGKAVYTMHIDIESMGNFLNFNNIENISKIGYFLKKGSNDLFNWFYENINTMECSCKNNRRVDIGGRKKRICGLMNRMQVSDPDNLDFERMKYVLELYHLQNLF